MADDKKKTIIDVSIDDISADKPIDIGSQKSSNEKKTDQSADELKQAAGEFVKTAGAFAGSLGKFALKKGTELKEKIEDEEFQAKVNSGIQSFADKVDDLLGEGTVIDVKGTGEGSYRINRDGTTTKSEPKKANRKTEEIITTVEVEGKDTVDFETKPKRKGVLGNIDNAKEKREQKKAEEKRKKEEEERRRKEKEKNDKIIVLIIFVCVMGFSFFMMNMSHDDTGSEQTADVEIEYRDVTSEDYSSLSEWDNIRTEGRGCAAPESFEGNDEDTEYPTVYLAALDKDGNTSDYGIEALEVYEFANTSVEEQFNDYVKMATEEQEQYVITLQGSFESLKSDRTDWKYKEYLSFAFSPEIVSIEKVDIPETDQGTTESEVEASDELKALVGMTCDEADPKVREMGYTPKYLTYETNGVVLFQVYPEDGDMSDWRVYEVNEVKDTEVTLIVKSSFMEERDKEQREVSASLSDSEARDIACRFIQDNFTKSFRMKDIPQYSIMDGGKRVWSLCKFKDNYGNTIEGEMIAQVNAKTKEVELVEIRNGTYGVIWSYQY